MTTLAEMLLVIARTVSRVREGTATGGSTTTLIDTALAEASGTYNEGTVWITHAGVTLSYFVSTFGNNTITFSPPAPQAVIAGDTYAVAPDDFPKWQLTQAVVEALSKISTLKVDTTLTVASGADVTLPAAVRDVRQVFVAGVRNYHWSEVIGKLKFDKTSYDGALEVRYASRPTFPAADSDIIDPAVDPEWLHWAAVVKLWRDYYRDHLKDNPVAIELFNEARQNEQMALNIMRTAGLLAPSRDFHYANW